MKTAKEFYDLAIWYCSRRETSRARMQKYLMRKAKGHARKLDEEELAVVVPAIKEALNQLERQKVIDDERYAKILVREYQRRTKGKRYIELKLREKGLQSQVKSIELDAEEELGRATHLVAKLRETTRFKKIDDRFVLRQKLIQRLLSAGFDLTLAKKAVALKEE